MPAFDGIISLSNGGDGINKIQLLKEPGYIYDLNFIFCLKFNTKLYTDNLPNDDRKERTVSHFNDLMDRFSDIPDDLYVFFHVINTGRAFLPTFYFNPYKDIFPTAYNFKYFMRELADQDILIRNFIKFYFCELDDESVEECVSSLNKIFDCIKVSDYSVEEKNKLYEFFINPSRYLQLLQYELMQKEVQLSEYYKENYQKIIKTYNEITTQLLCDQMRGLKDLTFLENEHNIYVSFCLLNNLCINFFPMADGFLSLLGYQYVSILTFAKDENKEPNLCNFGIALCEESRVKILKFIVEKGKITCKDLERKFSFSGSTAYHHITIMARSGLIKSQNEGKNIVYSVNKKYLSKIIDSLNKILKNNGDQT